MSASHSSQRPLAPSCLTNRQSAVCTAQLCCNDADICWIFRLRLGRLSLRHCESQYGGEKRQASSHHLNTATTHRWLNTKWLVQSANIAIKISGKSAPSPLQGRALAGMFIIPLVPLSGVHWCGWASPSRFHPNKQSVFKEPWNAASFVR